MAKYTIDLSGRGGLIAKYHGDLNYKYPSEHLRYLGQDGQFADGIFNPIKRYGYMSPSVNTFIDMTGTISAAINSIIYDASNDTIYLSEEGTNILSLSGLNDTSVSNYLTISSGTIKDMIIYEVNQQKSLIYAIDSGGTDGMYVGFKTLSGVDGMLLLDNTTFSATNEVPIDPDAGGVNISKLAQRFLSTDIVSLSFDSVKVYLRRAAGTGSYNLQMVILDDGVKTDSPYSDQGSWATSTTYAINDVVTHNSVDYYCIQGHGSSASDEPGVGGSWEGYWDYFEVPGDTTVATSTNVAASTIDSLGTGEYELITFTFSSPVTLSDATNYWFVIQENGSSMTSADIIQMKISDTATNPYRTSDGYPIKMYSDAYGTNHWSNTAEYGTTNEQTATAAFQFYLSEDEDWSSTSATGSFTEETGQDTFLYLSDNALTYWFTGRNVHTIDGSGTGGYFGVVNQNVLSFPSYVTVTDVAETRSRMYIGIQTSDRTTALDDRYFTANRSGVYVWDRRSQVVGGSDFVPTPGAREIKALFPSSDGSVKAITVGNSGYTEIRAILGNQFAVLHTLERDAYPASRRGISQFDNLTVWLGANGIFYGFGPAAPGEPERLYKIGDMSGEAGSGLVSGPIFVGNEYSTGPTSSIIYGWSDSTPSYNVQKWYPCGEGILDAKNQMVATGNVYTKVNYLPRLSFVRDITMYCQPTTTADDTTIATVKIYKNQSTTPFMTKTITNTQASRGYVTFDVNKPDINALQLEFEWASAVFQGDEEFYPSVAIVDYDPTNTHSPSKD